jgi:hypothetical protein
LIAHLKDELNTQPHRLCLFRVLLGTTTTVTTFSLPHTLGKVALHPCSLWLACLVTVHVGSVSSPLCSGAFLTPRLLQAFPLLVAGQVQPLLPSLAYLFIYSSIRDCPPPPLALRVPCPPCYMSFVAGVIVVYSVCFLSLFSLGGGQSV